MRSGYRLAGLAALAGLLAWQCALADLAPAQITEIRQIDLQTSFHTRSAWRLVVTEGPPAEDYGGSPAPGALQLCFEKSPATTCTPKSQPVMPPRGGHSDEGWEPHYLKTAEPVWPQGASAAPLLLVVTGSMFSGDGDQWVVTQLFRYTPASDAFERVYEHATGKNENEEVRFTRSGPLRGDVISAEPMSDLHTGYFGYSIEVDSYAPEHAYRKILSIRSATRYGDGNKLGVIDSEMPNIEQRLGLWQLGQPLPLPAGTSCPKPHLKRGEMWCE